MILNDAAARKEALDPKQSFLVQAPAGSGKTEILSQRYLNLLSYVNAPEEIIALTFTDKAANEMQHRIYKALLHAQNQPEPQEPHKKLSNTLAKKALEQNTLKQWQLLISPKRLRIMTIDAFCQSLSKQLAFETDEAFNAEITDSPKLLYEQAIDNLINDTNKKSSFYQDFYQLLAHLDNDINRVKQLLISMLANREQWLGVLLESEFVRPGKNDSKAIIESGFKALFTQLSQQLHSLLKLEQNQLRLIEILIFCDEKNSDFTVLNQNTPVFWQNLIKLLFTNDNVFRKTFNARQGLPVKDAKAKSYSQWLIQYTQTFSDTILLRIYPLVVELRLFQRLLFNDQEWQILSAIARIALRLAQYLKLVFKERALLDFNEVALQALSALGTNEHPTNLILYLDYQIKHLLIDEFQDTSILQFKLLQMLTLKWQPNDDKTLFVVGDPMQSIYRFRQAEVNQFLDIKSQGINQVKLKFLQLDCNFRSQKAIIDWVNQSFAYIFPAQNDRNYGGISYAPATTLLQGKNDNAVNCALFQNIEQKVLFIADTIKAYCHKHPTHQVAILVRTRSHLKEFVPILKSHDIAVVENDIETFYHKPMVTDLICLCMILANPEQAVYLISLLQSPLFGFSLNELHQIEQMQLGPEIHDSFYSKFFAYLQTHQAKPHEQKACHFLSWLNTPYFNGVRSTLIERLKIIWLTLDGLSIHPDNILFDSFINLLKNHLTQDKTSIMQFDQFMVKIKEKFITVPSTSNVLIMTIHKSKGLEFDFVILPQLEKRCKSDDSHLFLHDTVCLDDHQNYLLLSPIKHSWSNAAPALYQVIQSMQKKRSNYELQRLLYVAVTRAKSKLLLTALSETQGEISSANNSFLALLSPLNLPWIILENSPQNISMQKAKDTTVRYKSIQQVQNYSITSAPRFDQHAGTLEANDLNHPDFSELVASIDRQIGLALHQLFNYLCTNLKKIKHIDNWHNYFNICLHQHAIAKHNHLEAYTLAKIAITHTLEGFPWILNAPGLSEQVMLHLSFNKAQKHIADRVIIDNNQYYIIDYKFTTPVNNETLADFLIAQTEAYHAQLTNYQKLIACYLKIDQFKVKILLYFPLIPYLHKL